MDSYAAEKTKSFKYVLGQHAQTLQLTSSRATAPLGKGMQLGKKSKATSMFDQVRGDLGPEEEASTPLVAASAPIVPVVPKAAISATAGDREAIHLVVAESISAKLSREGAMESFEVKGDLQLRISDASLTQVKLDVTVDDASGAQFSTHPKVDRALFNNSKILQLKDFSKGFPANNSIGVMRWRYVASASSSKVDLPLTLTAWVNPGSDDSYSITLEYELTGNDTLKDVTITIPYATSEPVVSSFDAVYEVSGDSLDWTVGTIDEDNNTGSFEFEAQADSDSAFFPMTVRFSKTKPFVDVDVSNDSAIEVD